LGRLHLAAEAQLIAMRCPRLPFGFIVTRIGLATQKLDKLGVNTDTNLALVSTVGYR